VGAWGGAYDAEDAQAEREAAQQAGGAGHGRDRGLAGRAAV
jgi:hypothetical protein